MNAASDVFSCDLSEPILIPLDGFFEDANEISQLCFANGRLQSSIQSQDQQDQELPGQEAQDWSDVT